MGDLPTALRQDLLQVVTWCDMEENGKHITGQLTKDQMATAKQTDIVAHYDYDYSAQPEPS